MPFGLVETNGSNSLAAMPSARPGPVSVTAISTMRSSRRDVATSSSRRRLASMASMALRMRLTSTCWIWMRSTSNVPGVGLEMQPHLHAERAGPLQGQRTSLLDHRRHPLHPLLRFAAAYKFAQAPHDLPGAQDLLAGLTHHLPCRDDPFAALCQ